MKRVVFVDALSYREDEHRSWVWLFQRWNERRDLVARRAATSVVWLLPPKLDEAIALWAPDVWSVRGLCVRLPA